MVTVKAPTNRHHHRGVPSKSAKDRIDIISAYYELGSYRGAADKCGTTHRTVKKIIDKHQADQAGVPPAPRAERAHNYDAVAELVTARMEKSQARISAKRLLPIARAAGYEGSSRNFRRLVARSKALWRRSNHSGRRPAVWSPGQYLVIDWAQAAPGLFLFCAVLAFSRWRFVRFATDQKASTTLALIAEALSAIGGVPARVLADRMACLKGGAAANAAAVAWCAEVNAVAHSEIQAIPDERLIAERELLQPLPSLRLRVGVPSVLRKVDRLACVRYGSARYSVPTRLIGTAVAVVVDHRAVCLLEPATGMIVAEHELVAPGSASILDEHYDGPRPAPRRGPRPTTSVEKQFCDLGPDTQAFLVGAAAIGNTRLGSELEILLALGAAHGTDALVLDLPVAPTRSLDAYKISPVGDGEARS